MTLSDNNAAALNKQDYLNAVQGVSINHNHAVAANAFATVDDDNKCFIFDVDGTLADCTHRQKFLNTKPKNWKAFTQGALFDKPHVDIIWLLKLFAINGHTILIVTGRGEESREVTVNWLDKVAGIKGLYEKVYMRGLQDYRDDSIVKSELLDEIYEDGYQPFMVFDDRSRVVDMWRDRGIRCLQVQAGDF